jgi:hypothetical protein
MLWFWLVLALFYLALTIVTFIMSRPIRKKLEALVQEGPDSSLQTTEGKEISLNQTLFSAYKSIIITDMIGFFLAALAAIVETITKCN